MSDSDSDIEKVCSQPGPTQPYDKVPEEKRYKFKLFTRSEGPGGFDLLDKFGFDLKQGKELPYVAILKGFKIEFSRELVPSVEGYKPGIMDEKFWNFEKKSSDILKDLATFESSPVASGSHSSSVSSKNTNFNVPTESSTQSPSISVRNPFHKMNMSEDLVTSPSSITSSAAKLLPETPRGSQNSKKRRAIIVRTPGSVPLEDSSSDSESDAEKQKLVETPKVKETQHTEPKWLENLTGNFYEKIIEQCSGKTRIAVNNNEVIKIPRDHRQIRNEILNAVMTYLKTFFSGADNLPSLKAMREISYTLSYTYPAMFQYPGEGTNIDLAPEKPDELANKMKERLRGQLRIENKNSVQKSQGEDGPPRKKGKGKVVYGVDMAVWNGARKAKPPAVAALNAASKMQEFEQREAIYEDHREEITAEFKSGKPIPNICRGFWKSDLHLANQFSYLTKSPPVNGKVEMNLIVQFENMEKFLIDQCKTVTFRDQMDAIETTIQLEKSGSLTLKYIHLLRFAGIHLDEGKGPELVRLESDGAPDHSSPHILAIETNK